MQRTISTLDERRIPIWVAGAACEGTEDVLSDCPEVGFGNKTDACSFQNILSVICFTSPDSAREGNLRLQDGDSGPGYEYGRLEIFLRGFWSTICDNSGFTPDTAVLACSLLGFDGGAALRFRVPYNGESNVLAANLPVGLASVDCDGDEASLLECTASQNDILSCGIDNINATDATVLACGNAAPSCDKTPPMEEGSVRLRGGFGSLCDPVYTGFVEVFHFEEWGAICTGSDDTDRLAADVICRQLGFPHGTLVDPLTNPADPVRIYNDYGGYTYAPYDPAVEEADEPQDRFWLSFLGCRGPEDTLLQCDLGQGFRTNNNGCSGGPVRLTAACRTFPVGAALEDVATPGAQEGDVRLVDQSTVANWQLGRLEVFFEGSWSQICAKEFDGPDANVACRQLGFGAGTVGPNRANGAQSAATSTIVFPEVAVVAPGCNGTEANLLECGPAPGRLSSFQSQDCFGDDGPGLLIACVTEPQEGEEGALRLTDGGNGDSGTPGIGILEIFHAGAWGTVCSAEGFDYDYGPPLTEARRAISLADAFLCVHWCLSVNHGLHFAPSICSRPHTPFDTHRYVIASSMPHVADAILATFCLLSCCQSSRFTVLYVLELLTSVALMPLSP
eukprot:jgi/Ulvmu1/3396/UM016_0012.1